MNGLRRDLEAITKKDRCKYEEDRSDCQDLKTVDPVLWDAQCKECGKGAGREISAFTSHIIKIYRLARGGYPFRANDLSFSEWQALGIVKDYLEPRMF